MQKAEGRRQKAERGTLAFRLLPSAFCLLLALALSALLLFLAYQTRPSYAITIGTPTDGPLLDGFSGGEKSPPGFDTDYKSYRWMEGYGIVTLRDIGQAPYRVSLTVNAARPPGQPPAHLKVEARGTTLLDIEPKPSIATYVLTVPAALVPDGTLTLDITTNPFSPPGDTRELGIVFVGIAITPECGVRSAECGVRVPPGEMWVAVLGTVALVSLLLAALGWGLGTVVIGGSLPAIFAAALLVWDRLWLTSRLWYNDWLRVSFYGLVFVAVLWLLGGLVLRRSGTAWTPMERRAILTIAFSAFVVRLTGELHPQIFVYDVGFHANRLHLVEEGTYLFSTQPAEFGGVESVAPSTFYLPTCYFFVIPLKWLLGDERLAIRVLLVAMGTLGTLPLFYLAKRFAGSARAGVIAALLYVTLPMAILPYSWGIMPNIFGEFLALMAITFMVGSAASGTLHPRHYHFYLLIALFAFALLGHPGVVFLFAGVAVLFWILDFGYWVRTQKPKLALSRGEVSKVLSLKSARWSIAAFGIALILAFTLYYHHFAEQMVASAQTILSKRSEGEFSRIIGGSVEDRSLGLMQREVKTQSAWIWGGVEGLWREMVAYYRAWPLLGALLGFLLVRPLRRGMARHAPALKPLLTRTALAWALAVLLFAFVAWFANVYVRYMLFALPIVALGTGILVAHIWRHGWTARIVSVLVLGAFTLWAFVLWGDRITFAFKG